MKPAQREQYHYPLRHILCVVIALTMGMSMTAMARPNKTKMESTVENAALGVFAYDKSKEQCHYEPVVGRTLSLIENKMKEMAPLYWQKAISEAPLAMNYAANMAKIQGESRENGDCKVHGLFVGQALFLSLSIGMMDPVVMSEMDRLFQGGGRARKQNSPAQTITQQKAKAPSLSSSQAKLLQSIIGAWAETQEECLDEEGPNSRMVIQNDPKNGPMMLGYEIECRIDKIEGQMPAELHMTCADEEGNAAKEVLVIGARGPQSLDYRDRSFMRCPK